MPSNPEPIITPQPAPAPAPNHPGWKIVLMAGIFVGGFLLGNQYRVTFSSKGIPSVISNTSSDPTNAPLFDQVRVLLQNKYLRANQLDDQALLYGAISGMVKAAGDPYTNFFDPKSNADAESQLSGTYEGIGAQLGYDKNQALVVIAPIRQSPAEKAGIKAGDLILEINGKSTDGISLADAVNQIRGKANTQVKLLLSTAGTVHEMTVTRQQITIDSIELSFRDDPATPAADQDIAYLQLSRFGDTTNSEWDRAVTQINNHQAKALVLDLRNNPGGYLDAAIHIASDFFKDGIIVGQQNSAGKVQEYTDQPNNSLLNIPVIVLINKGSASASEIVSGALQSRHRATILGETSFGKGSVQEVINLPQGSSLHVTTAKWLLPNGKNIDKEGIKPDQEVKPSTDPASTVDLQLDAALQQAGQAAK